MALDEPQDNDLTFEKQGINFAIEKDLVEKAKPIRVDFIESDQGAGFKLTSSLPATEGCGSGCNC